MRHSSLAPMIEGEKSQVKQTPISFGAYPEEIARWRVLARADRRPLSQWIRIRLLAADAQDEERVARSVERTDQ